MTESATVLQVQDMEMSSIDEERTLTMLEDIKNDGGCASCDLHVVKNGNFQAQIATETSDLRYSKRIEDNTDIILEASIFVI